MHEADGSGLYVLAMRRATRMPPSRSRSTAAPLCRKAATAPSVAAAGLTSPGGYTSRVQSFVADGRFKRFQRVVAGLRSLCPPAFPVVIRTKQLAPGIEGTCARHRNRFVICIADRLNEKAGIEVLLHEWAHALSWTHKLDSVARMPLHDEDLFERLSHGPEWGVAYADVWRCFVTQILPGL
jgi:hypothetical protein